jgi:hypothetical protein
MLDTFVQLAVAEQGRVLSPSPDRCVDQCFRPRTNWPEGGMRPMTKPLRYDAVRLRPLAPIRLRGRAIQCGTNPSRFSSLREEP